MVTLSEQQITGIVSLALILSGTVLVQYFSDSYYCASEDNVKQCLRLSPYYLLAEDITKGDRCTGGVWKPLEDYVKKTEKPTGREGVWLIGAPDGINCFEYGDLRREVKCPE